MNQAHNTGKVRIGGAYVRPPLAAHTMDRDAVQIQSALLDGDRPIDHEDKIVMLACVIAVVAVAWILS
jgi:hypothetical protein